MSSTTPARPATKPTVDEQTERIILERNASFDKDRKTAVDAREALASIRKTIPQPMPR